MTDSLTQARACFLDGLAAFESGRLPEAARHFEAALELAPGRPSVMLNLGITRMRLGQPRQAMNLLEQVTALEPEDPAAWFHRAGAHAQLGQLEASVAAWDRLLALDPRAVDAWVHRGSALRELGRLDAAADSFRRARALGGDATLLDYYLAGSGATADGVPQAAPRDYVAQLFNEYADEFGAHLVQALRYEAPERLVTALPAPAAGHWKAVLDLGCGTGLVGALLRPSAKHLVGLDLADGMVRRAQSSGHYDAVEHADLVPWLAATGQRFDLVVAADVFIYVGALEPVFAGVRRVLSPRGVLAFSVETPDAADGGGLVLLPSLRYAHGEAYVRNLAARHGLRVLSAQAGPLREDQKRPVAGQYWVLQGPAA
jgi:predicted TPR repeat methyltransferase